MDSVIQDQLLKGGATAFFGLLTAFMVYKLYFYGPKKVLPLEDYQEFPLIRKEELSHDVRRFVFGLPSKDMVLGLPVGQHISLKFTDSKTGKVVMRSYTPVDSPMGEVHLIVKVYRPCEKFPEGGLMSQHLDDLKIQDTQLIKGPKGHLTWYGNGKFSVKPLGKPLEERKCAQIGMMAGGTGITPMLQILHDVFREQSYPPVRAKLIFANQTEDDILVRTELETLAKDFPNHFSLRYTLDRPPKKWDHSSGFITEDMVKEHLLFNNDKPTQFFMCGPPPMIKFACLPALKAAGYSEKDWVVY